MSESETAVVNIKYQILDLLTELNQAEIKRIEEWFCKSYYKKDLERKKSYQDAENSLKKIGNVLKKVVPFEAEMKTEKIIPPTVGDSSDCNSINTYHVDEFLYDHEEVEKLYRQKKLNKHYCVDCHSRNIEDLTLISHSSSRQSLQYMFTVLLPKDLCGKTIMDVGSRIGAVIFGAYYLSNASEIIGVEMNKECCDIQDNIITQFNMDSSRIKVVNSDVMERVDLVIKADVVIINILDFFIDIETHKKLWFYFMKHMKKGALLLLCNRSIVDTLATLDIYEDFVNWLEICKTYQIENEIFCDIEDGNDLYLYMVK